MQHKFKIGSREFLAVGVPVISFNFKILKETCHYQLEWTNETGNIIYGKVFLYKYFGGSKNYPTSMKILFSYPDCTEAEAASVIEKDKDGGYYECYTDHKIYFDSAKESLASKMEAEIPDGLRVHDKYLILEITTR